MKTLRYILLVLGLLLVMPQLAIAQAPPQPIEYGETLAGSIDAAGAEAVFLFDAASGDQITATVSSADGNLDPVLELTTFTRTLLATDDNSGPDGSAQITYFIPADGTYNLVVRGVGGSTGAFALSLASGIVQPTPDEVPATPDAVVTQPATTTIADSGARLQRIRIGSTVSGTVSGDATFNLYAFEGAADQEIAITPDPRTSFQPLLVLYDSTFTELTRAQPGNALRLSLPAADWYFVAAATIQAGTGGAFGFSVLDQAPAAQPAAGDDGLRYNSTQSGAITDASAVIRYRFAGSIGDPVTISMATVSGDLDAYVLLVDASGNVVGEDDNSGENTDAQLSVTLPATSDYFILATRRGQETGLTSGEFVLALTSTATQRTGSASRPPVPEDFIGLSTIDIGNTVTGRISNAVYQEFYVFYGEAGDALTITLEAATGSTLDPLLILLDAERISVAENDDVEQGNQNSRIDVTLPQTGYYAIVAARFELSEGSTQGAYELSLVRQGGTLEDVAPPFEQLDPIRVIAGNAPTESFTPLQFADVFTFSVAEGALIDFAATTNDGTVPTVIITDSALDFVAASDTGVILAVTAPRSDDYLAFVAPQGGPIANVQTDYRVTLSADIIRSNAETGASIPISYGATVRGTITDEAPAIRYVFQGRANDVVEISMTARSAADPLDTFLRLQDADGNVIAENDDINPGVVRDSFITQQLSADGEYTIIATRYSGTTAPITAGEFNLTLSIQDPIFTGVDRTANLIRYGQTVTEAITDETDLFFFYFEGNQGDSVTIEIETVAGNLDAVMYLYAITSTGDFLQLAYNDDSPLGNTLDPYIEYTLPRTGGYVVAVTRFENPDAATNPDLELTEGEFSILVLEQP